MKQLTMGFLVALALGGCAQYGQFVAKNKDNDCGGKGRADIKIEYGDAKLIATAKTRIGRTGELSFVLVPDKKSDFGIDYSQVEVVIEGKTADAQWINTQGKATKKKTFSCVDANQAPGDYDFLVKVPGVGVLDPRAIVVE